MKTQINPVACWLLRVVRAGFKDVHYVALPCADGREFSAAVDMAEVALQSRACGDFPEGRAARVPEGWSMTPLFSEAEDMGLVLVEEEFQRGGRAARLLEVREFGHSGPNRHVALMGSGESFSRMAARVSEMLVCYYGGRSPSLSLLRHVGELTMWPGCATGLTVTSLAPARPTIAGE